ncbi:MAG: hypothetical protein MK102_19205, partial [Fuerstiella sp.]|nr:hypothetical protein [Fuerstiella sp.]
MSCSENRTACGATDFVRVAFGLLFLISAVAVAHPTSHVDAWAQAGDQFRVRLTFFLGDVLAAEGINHPEGCMDQSAVTDALGQFSLALPSRLVIFGPDGEPLVRTVSEEPSWHPPTAGIDLSVDSSLRLTWTLTTRWDPEWRSFSLQHSFRRHQSPADGVDERAEPAELRLRVREENTGRRQNLRIGHHDPHTVLLPTAISSTNRQLNRIPVSARFVLLPRQLIHEVTMPLVFAQQLIAPAGFPGARQADERIAKQNFLRAIREWVEQSCETHVDDRVLSVRRVNVRLLTAENDEADDRISAVVGTRLGIRLSSDIRSRPNQVTVHWRGLPSMVDEVQVHTLADGRSVSSVVDVTGGDATLKWSCSAVGTGTTEMTSSELVCIAPSDIWEPRKRVKRMWLLLAVICVASLIGLIKKWRWILLTAFSVVVLTGVARDLSQPMVQPAAELAAPVESMLTEIYQAAFVPDERLVVARLNSVMTEELSESVFQTVAPLLSSDDAPLIRVDRLNLHSCSPLSWNSEQRMEIDCRWAVGGEVLHWGHRHQRELMLHAV